ncbi:outer membrane protein [Pedobacter sp. CG_S7]|uniref:TolC family protein n=1 Tax=Pedobacter sp. CG_S7 TaxID=3143930 RepID=UPI0033912B63
MKQYKFILLLFLASNFNNASAQEYLSLKEAIALSLKNNYDIKLVNNDVQIAKNNVSYGNAGILPALQGNFSEGGSNQNTTQITSTGEERNADGVRNTNMNYGVDMGWTIFDGLKMFATYDKLKELQKLGEVNEKAIVLSTIAQVINAYYDLVRQQQLVAATDSALDISRFRVRIAQNKLQIGKGSKLDVLTATVDYNTDTSALLQQKNLVQNAIVNLNQVMARDLNLKIRVREEIAINDQLLYSKLQEATLLLNPVLQNAFINKKVAELSLKEVKAQRYPVVALNGGYGFSRNTNPTGFNKEFQARGLTYGITASINIFNGFLQRQNERNAKIGINSSQLTLEKTQQTISATLLRAYQDYQTNLDLLKVEQGNIEIAKQNLAITFDKYRLGSIAPLELREAQRNSIQAITRFLDAQHQAKLTEISLKEISGTLNIQ